MILRNGARSTARIVGLVTSTAGTALWLYGYFWSGRRPAIEWSAIAPWWIADYLPSLECEIGMVLMLAAMVPLSWPVRVSAKPKRV